MLLVDLAIEFLESFKVKPHHFISQNDLYLTRKPLKMSLTGSNFNLLNAVDRQFEARRVVYLDLYLFC
jgi:hypothetical protein